MSQHDMVIENQGFAATRADINAALAALATNSSGATEPATTYAFQPWADTTADRLKIRNAANDGWVSVLVLSTGAPVSGADAPVNTNITSMGNNTSTIYTTAGTSTAYTITPNPVIAAYAAGQSFVVNFNAASGASPTLAISDIATPPNLVKENGDGTYSNIAANEIPANHRSRVTLIGTTQALVERMPQGTTYGTPVAAASQTAMNFTGIPPNAKKVTVILADFGTNGSSVVVLRGGSGSVETASYVYSNGQVADGGSPVVSLSPTSGFGFNGNAWSSTIRINGKFELLSVGSNQWEVTGSFGRTDAAILCFMGGRKTFSGALDRLQMTTVGGVDLITNGSVQVNYEV